MNSVFLNWHCLVGFRRSIKIFKDMLIQSFDLLLSNAPHQHNIHCFIDSQVITYECLTYLLLRFFKRNRLYNWAYVTFYSRNDLCILKKNCLKELISFSFLLTERAEMEGEIKSLFFLFSKAVRRIGPIYWKKGHHKTVPSFYFFFKEGKRKVQGNDS